MSQQAEQFNVNVFDKITTSNNNNNKINAQQNQGFFYYFQLARQSNESKKLANLIILLSLISLYCIITGFQVKNFEKIEVGSYAILHISAYIYSIFALLKAKHSADKQFTHGFSRYETLAAFSNCIFLIITALFMLLQSVHFHSEEEGGENGDGSEDQQNDNMRRLLQGTDTDGAEQADDTDHHENTIYIYYILLIYNIFGAFSFAEYALFVPMNDISKEHNISGVSHGSLDNYNHTYKQLHKEIQTNNDHDENHLLSYNDNEQQEQNNNNNNLQSQQQSNRTHQLYSSHFENMHSVFLHFLVDLIFNLGHIFSHLLESTIPTIHIFVAIFTMFITVTLCKRILVVTSRLLLQALPIEDKKSVTEFMNSVNKIEGVVEIKEQYFWGITTGYLVCDLKLVIQKNANQEQIKRQVHLHNQHKFQHITLHLESEL